MPSIEAFLTSIQDALSCLEERARKGWPTDEERQSVNNELADIDSRLWELCEIQR